MLSVIGVALGCAGCGALEVVNQPLDENSGFNPLDLPGSSQVQVRDEGAEPDATGSAFNAGDYVETSVPNTPFFKQYPGSGAAPSKVLAQGMVLRVVKAEGSYLKVSSESGDEGYVANVMVIPQGLLVGGVGPELPPVVPGEVPTVDPVRAPEPEIPGLEPPVEVDPNGPVPPVAPPIPADPEVPEVEEPAVAPDPPKKEDPAVAPEPEIPGLEQ